VAHGGPKLGDLLLSRGVVDADMLAAALLEQSGNGRRLGEILVEQGLLSEDDLTLALAEQLGLERVDLRRSTPEPEALALVPEATVRMWRAIPVSVTASVLTVAAGGLLDDRATQQLREHAGGRALELVVASNSDLDRAIDRSYDALAGLERFVTGYADPETVATSEAEVLAFDDSAPVVQVVQRIITQAVRERASDVHIEPQDNIVRVRFRVDGALHDVVNLPIAIAQSLVSRIKIMADMNIVERRRSQDGQFEAKVDGRALDVRVATTATIWGEKAVLRLLDKSRSLLRLDRLGMPPTTRREFLELVRSPFGMVICAGPTGSGKTTTLYAALSEINSPERNIMTIEDPVEYVFPSINQIQINEQADITFSGGLKAILRQDPDVILVGEMRDVETARIAVQSALTGHFVLSTIHATDATAALHRFLDMGIESFLVASAVIGIVAQRLVRRICTACKEPYEPTDEDRELYAEWGGKPKGEFYHGAGCSFCAHTGYSERIGVYELLRADAKVKQLIVRQATLEELRAAAADQGMRTLRDEAVRLVEYDITTIPEVLRSIYVL
jgi:type IV pilus assembly protein PilB